MPAPLRPVFRVAGSGSSQRRSTGVRITTLAHSGM